MSDDLDAAPLRTVRGRSGLREWKRHRRGRRIAIAGAIAAVLVVGINLYFTPAHTYDRAAHETAWLVAIQDLHGVNGCSSPPTAVAYLAGVGEIAEVCVAKSDQKIITVTYWKTTGQDAAGLAYGSPPCNTCATSLGGPWWQIGPFDPASMSCQHGFTFTPGP